MKTENSRYDDIICLPHPTSMTRSRMSLSDRAAQFSPFAALTGYDAAIRETARLTETQIELDEGGKALLNEKLQKLAEQIQRCPEITVTYFVPDERKTGGTYVQTMGRLLKIDPYAHTLVMTDKTAIPVERIYEIDGEFFDPYITMW